MNDQGSFKRMDLHEQISALLKDQQALSCSYHRNIASLLLPSSTIREDQLVHNIEGNLWCTELLKLEKYVLMKSKGTNWLSQILTDPIALSQKKTPGSESSLNADELEVFPYLEIGDAEKYEFFMRMTKLPLPRFMVTNLHPENLPKSIFQNNAKILLLIRNPKDVATSYYHFSKGVATVPSYETWDGFFTDFMTKKKVWAYCLEYLSEWNKYVEKENIKTVAYEEVKENPALSVKNIATFFGIPLTEEELQLVIERSSFQSMKKNSDKTHGAFGNILFHKGGVSDWKNLFSEDQSEEMDKAFEEHIAGTKLGKC
ncbi:hypothetical protein DV515_00010709 [Chloebia gouldiae]|uniref:Sulfotransferase n=1 Tax=Chloebia gouldiae TaxID=44316 RepID=A0A3L8S9L9_CHLGU|nr:hypothetical protein DV515_00010709 [Chloebia gouldiae]